MQEFGVGVHKGHRSGMFVSRGLYVMCSSVPCSCFSGGRVVFAVEPYIHGTFCKYTNNYGWINPGLRVHARTAWPKPPPLGIWHVQLGGTCPTIGSLATNEARNLLHVVYSSRQKATRKCDVNARHLVGAHSARDGRETSAF